MAKNLIDVPCRLRTLAMQLNKPLYIVGGYVRDWLANGEKSADIDLCGAFCIEDFRAHFDRENEKASIYCKNSYECKNSKGECIKNSNSQNEYITNSNSQEECIKNSNNQEECIKNSNSQNEYITNSNSQNECAKCCKVSLVPVNKKTGTFLIVFENEAKYEFTPFRTEEYTRGHTPNKVSFTDSLSLDALRRDFTVNAVYYDIKANRFVDPLNGIEDIENRVLRLVDGERTLKNDGLRIMRLARLRAKGFIPDELSLRRAKENIGLLRDISAERHQKELDYIFSMGAFRAQGAMEILCRLNAFKEICDAEFSGKSLQAYCNIYPNEKDKDMLLCAFLSESDCFSAVLNRLKYKTKTSTYIKKILTAFKDIATPYFIKTEGEAVLTNKAEQGENKLPNALKEESITHKKRCADNTDCMTELRLNIANAYEYRQELTRLIETFTALNCVTNDCLSDFLDTLGEIERLNLPICVKTMELRAVDLKGIPPERLGQTLNRILKDALIKKVPNERERLFELL